MTDPTRSRYVTMRANIPTYDRSNPMRWVPNGPKPKPATLALVGVHVVFSAAQHPEMLWATFEHVDNTPNAEYTYNTAGGGARTIPQSTSGTWLFSASGATEPFDEPHMQLKGDDIVADDNKGIRPNNLLRIYPWGTDATDVRTNTLIISLNNSVKAQLGPRDPRRNYILTGTTWTYNGRAPGVDAQDGTRQLSNTTIEAFFQQAKNGCFACHQGSDSEMLGLPSGGGVSHIYGLLKPLFARSGPSPRAPGIPGCGP